MGISTRVFHDHLYHLAFCRPLMRGYCLRVADNDKPQSVLARVIILSQACDLANDKTARLVVHNAANLVETGRVKEKFIRDNVRQGPGLRMVLSPRRPDVLGVP